MKIGSVLMAKKKLIAIPAVVVIAFLVPLVIKGAYTIHILNMAFIYLIAVYGLNFITGMAGQMNLGTAGIFCLGAYTAGIFTTRVGISPWLALIPVIGMGLLIGILLGYPSLRISGVYLSLTTVAFTEIVRLILNNWTGFTGGATGLKSIPRFSILGYAFRSHVSFYYLILVIVIIFSIITYRIIHSKWGRAFIAVRDNPDAVESCGISLAKAKITAFTLAAVFGALAGAFYAHNQGYLNPSTFTMDMSILFVVMMLFGGAGNMFGCIVGAFIISLLPELLRVLGEYYQLSYAFIVLLFAVFIPGGLVSFVKNLIDKRSTGKPTA